MAKRELKAANPEDTPRFVVCVPSLKHLFEVSRGEVSTVWYTIAADPKDIPEGRPCVMY